ncbi:MAG: alpha/beta hydrolase [Acidimicrobiales bacterium]
MPFIDVDGLQMYYEMHGDPEAPPVLMISGTGNDLRWSQPDRNPINKAGYVCHFDQRGLGQTDKPDGPYTMAQYADDAAGLAAALGWSRCHVVGTSFGGMVALNLVQRHPDLVDRLVLNCTSPGGDHASFPLHTLTDLPPDELLDRRMRLTDGRYDPDADEPLPGIPRVVYDAMLARGANPPSGEAAAGARRQLEARAGHDVNAALPAIASPTLVCAGRYDHIAPLSNAEKLANDIPDAVLRVFEGGHLFMMQDRDAFAAITTFVQTGQR